MMQKFLFLGLLSRAIVRIESQSNAQKNVVLCYTSYKMYHTDYDIDYCVLGNTPVCATNGHEYFRLDNECELNNFNSKQLEKSQLVLSKTSIEFCYPPASSITYSTYCPQYCSNALKPLCASYRNVQRNFTNECLLKKHICDTKENWQIILNSTCVAASCPLNVQEVCASFNGYTQSFPNLLSLYGDIQARGKNWQILNVGPCPCPEDYRPLCAHLNCTSKTFTNECFLEREIKNGSHWSLLFYGECPELPTTRATPKPDSPVSADNDVDEGVESGDGPLDVESAVDDTLSSEPKAVINKPVYIVKKNQIIPHVPLPQVYSNKPPLKPTDYYTSHTQAKTYKNTYEKSQNKIYEQVNTPLNALYADANPEMYDESFYNYVANVNPPDYQSFFKALSVPLAAAAISLVSSAYNNNDYYAPKTITDVNYQTHYAPKYNPVSFNSYSNMPSNNYAGNYVNMPNNNYADVNYNDENLFDSLYGSLT